MDMDKVSPPHQPSQEPIAVVGSSCRFPGGITSPSKLWEVLCRTPDLLREIPPSRFNTKGFYHPDGDRHGSTNVTRSYLLEEDPAMFDSAFFNINMKEAVAIDPQQRLLLEIVYEALESGGFTIGRLQGSTTAVFVGLITTDYHEMQLRDIESAPTYLATGTARSISSNRISYFFDWKGPSVTLDTACSSSLVAVHMAVQSLRNGEVNVAVAAGANLILGPEMYISESKLHMLSPTGRSRMWDADADGYARGEGFSAVILKPLSRALADGDHIECIIRETGVNQDGRTKGITMPNAASQISLIRRTYERAGLDWRTESDRPQFFEAHGTGTRAGDPIEAEAVCKTFFGTDDGELRSPNHRSSDSSSGKLYVGSVKTVLGHLKGCAGLASLLKASLAVQNGRVPPNMHFLRLNPAIEPYYHDLEVPKACRDWPTIPQGTPRRVSVNSFGFGGTNAHAIIESCTIEAQTDGLREDVSGLGIRENSESLPAVCPLLFSAKSERALVGNLEAFVRYLNAEESVNLDDVAWTLRARRDSFPVRAAFAAFTRESLVLEMEKALQSVRQTPGVPIGIRSRSGSTKPRILGIFTGQGAQWPSMGRELITSSTVVRCCIDQLETALVNLPDAPAWSLKQELMADASSSRLHEAEIAQPLCTAVQVALVDLLQHADVAFNGVVGHSSGEIAAAYASGFISAQDAIRIAYYRGLHAKSARGPETRAGAMMAVGISYEEASEICNDPQFNGKVSVVASNAHSSVTLSGDACVIQVLKGLFDKRGIFARLLKVDTAYHSHHMAPCAAPYLDSLHSCGIQPDNPEWRSSVWVSSVYGRCLEHHEWEALKDSYWVETLVRPVLFSQSLEKVLSEQSAFDVAIEVGPHATLKAPATQTMEATLGASLPYHGLLSRDRNDIDCFSTGLAFIWTHLGENSVNFDGYRAAFEGGSKAKPKLVTGLPTYTWEHEGPIWLESRISRKYRTRHERRHDLLGVSCSDDVEQELRWRNILRLEEVPWLQGHQVQNQVIFPAAGYLNMALQASHSLFKGRLVKLVELRDIHLSRAIALQEGLNGTETLFTLKQIEIHEGDNQDELMAEFACYSCSYEGADTWEKNASGQLCLYWGQPIRDALPSKPCHSGSMNKVDIDRFYSSLDDIGLNYSGLFRGLSSVKRRMHMATASISTELNLVHPAALDSSFQTVFAALCSPGDGSLTSPYVPTGLKHLRVSGHLYSANLDLDISGFQIDSYLTTSSSTSLSADVEIFDAKCGVQLIQIERLSCTSLDVPKPMDDRQLFAETVWEVDITSGVTDVNDMNDQVKDLELVDLCERLAFYHLRHLNEEINRKELKDFKWHYRRLFEFLDYLFPLIASGQHSTVRPEWTHDTYEQLSAMAAAYPGQIDIDLINAVGRNFPSIVRGHTAALEVMVENDMLNRIYKSGLGFERANWNLARIAKQIAHKHPRMRIIEVGAGTGGATKTVLDALKGVFSSYVFTDISTGFFEKAQDAFAHYSRKMSFKALDVEKDIVEQGFTEHSFDMVIASNVLHATRYLAETVKNVRRLLKPGGYLLLLEITSDILRVKLMMSGLPGWWLGGEDGRRYAPTISTSSWNKLLEQTGFSGVDAAMHDFQDSSKHMCSVLLSQAIDGKVEAMRQPLSSPYMSSQIDHLLIVGGQTMKTSRLVSEVVELLQKRSFARRISMASSLEDLDYHSYASAKTALSLTELDRPLFESMTPAKLSGLQNLMTQAENVLWATSGCRADVPYCNMTVGLGRSLQSEYPSLNLQFLDLEPSSQPTDHVRSLAETLLRVVTARTWTPSEGSLWTVEPELVLENGKLLVPRVMPNRFLNDRLNSTRRFLVREISNDSSSAELVWDGNCTFLRERKFGPLWIPSSKDVTVRVTHSLLPAIRTGAVSTLFLCLGFVIRIGSEVSFLKAGRQVLVLSPVNCSTVQVPAYSVLPCELRKGEEPIFLRAVAGRIISAALLSRLPRDGSLLVYEAEDLTALTIVQQATEMGLDVVCMTSKSPAPSQSLHIHPHISDRGLKTLLPAAVVGYLDFSKSRLEVGSRIQKCLSSSVPVIRIDTMLSKTARVPPKDSLHGSRESLLTACSAIGC